MKHAKKQKPPSSRTEIRELRKRIETIKDAHRADIRRELTPLLRRLAVLRAAEALRRAERALVKSVEADKINPQLELLGVPPSDQETQPTLPLVTQ
jgi:hypothetical protein